MKNANFGTNVYILSYTPTKITFFMARVSGPYICSDIDKLQSRGEKFIVFGNCDVLDSKIK